MLPEDQIYTFMDEAMKILKFLNKEQMNRNRKKILKTILSKVPEAFNFNVDEMLLDVKELDLLKLRSKMIKRRFVLREKAVKQKQNTGLKTSHLPPYHNEEYKKRNKQYANVKGIADTGADYNVSSLQALEQYTIKTEDPQYIKEVQFPDKAKKQVKKVVYARAMLKQGETSFRIGVQKFFVVDDPNWDEVIIGKRTLNYFGIKLDLAQADHSKEKEE
eukprot:snap_masked-scaffold_47-processed-gene-0.18-mRNA-1 protein AED:1.00 eAED:1.00 QI:0/0/0/0/1/1/2/0/217